MPVLRLSQLAAIELDGLCESPHDYPPKWALVLSMYVDESVDEASGMCIVGGYLGKRRNWAKYVDAWQKARAPHTSLHIKDMRLGSDRGKRRYKDVLAKLGPIPAECGLKPILGSICQSGYLERVQGTAVGEILAPYVMAIIAMLDAVSTKLPPGERVELIFEQQEIYAAQRDRAVSLWSRLMQQKNPDTRGPVAKWSSIPKGIMTEASDYLCYAVAQRDADRTSQKALLTAPILNAQRYSRNHTTAEVVHYWIDQLQAEGRQPLRKSTREMRRLLRGR